MKNKIKKVLIANRAEIAVRVIRTCREMNIKTVAVYSEIDRTSPHVRLADEAYLIGKAKATETYLNKEKIIEIALKSKADAIHPGYGFLSENAEFSKMIEKSGLIFIGPPAQAVIAMGDKIAARNIAKLAGVPVVPGSSEPITNISEIHQFGILHKYPILLKAAGGGGGKGMRIVYSENEIESAFLSAQSEAKSSFGDKRIYVEKYLENPRHIEFQVLADEYGNAVHLGERECSIQRRHQKIIEESPSVILSEPMRREMGEAAIKIALTANYVNAGTIEFLVDKYRNFYFLEMNTRLQVEHPITEMRTGVDLVKEQLFIAMGEPLRLKQEEIKFDGHALECRIYAEDSDNNFLPSIGTINKLQPPQGLGIREDRGVELGNQISVYYDPMISKLISWAKTRDEAIRRMTRALSEYNLTGVKTNINLCKWIINHPKFSEGDFDTHFLQNFFNINELRKENKKIDEALCAAVCLIHKYDSKENFTLASNNKNTVSTSNWKFKKLNRLRD